MESAVFPRRGPFHLSPAGSRCHCLMAAAPRPDSPEIQYEDDFWECLGREPSCEYFPMAFVILVCFIPFNGCHCNPAFQICPLLQHCSHPRSAWTLPPLTDPSWWESRPYEERPRDRSRSPRRAPRTPPGPPPPTPSTEISPHVGTRVPMTPPELLGPAPCTPESQ